MQIHLETPLRLVYDHIFSYVYYTQHDSPKSKQVMKICKAELSAQFAQREISNIFFSLITWTPPENPGVSKDVPLSTKLGFGDLVL